MNRLPSIPLVRAAVTLCCLTLVGCGSTQRPGPAKFLLDPGTPPSFAGLQRQGTLAVNFVNVDLRAADGGFLYKVSATQWETDPYNGFLIAPSQMMTSIIRQWISDSQQFRSVAIGGSPGGQDWVLRFTVTELYGDFQSSFDPKAVISLEMRLFRNTASKLVLVSEGTYERQISVSARTPSALVDSWNAGLREILTEVSRNLAQ
ncbi:MAG: hypothetical protein WA771_08605 [Chthoniobacterales bacterium]